MPYREQKARFENICFQVKLFYAENFKINLRNLRTIVGAKLCYARVILPYWEDTCTSSSKKLVPKGFFFPVPGTVGVVLNMDIGQGLRSQQGIS